MQAIVLATVGHHEIVGAQHAIVAVDLLKDTLCERHVGGFVLHDEPGTAAASVKKHRVAAPLHTIDVELYLVLEQWGGVVEAPDEVAYEMLAHPLLGCQPDIATA